MKTPDGSIVDSKGRMVFMSVERFLRDVCEGGCCFLCGTPFDEARFNNEHILPDWLLRAFDLHKRTITLPNSTTLRYDQYTVPCCCDCNRWLGKNIEEPVRDLLLRPHDETIANLPKSFPILVSWMYLIFLKTHLKDTKLRLHRDRRKPSDAMSSLLDLSSLHHVHCIARSLYVGTEVDATARPALSVLPAMTGLGEQFDYHDLNTCMSMLMRIGDKCLIMALDDSGMSQHFAAPFFEVVRGPLSYFQQRELLARIGFANLALTPRPEFYTEFNAVTGVSKIAARLPDSFNIEDHQPEDFGHVFFHLVEAQLVNMKNTNIKKICEGVRSGRWSFLVDGEGRFIKNSVEELSND